MGAGGKGANASVAASKLGSKVVMIGRLGIFVILVNEFYAGDDFFGEFNLSNLKKAGVETKYIQKSKSAMTSTAAITVSEDGMNFKIKRIYCIKFFANLTIN